MTHRLTEAEECHLREEAQRRAARSCGPTNHIGCTCHEARRDREIERLTRVCSEAAEKLTLAARHIDEGRILDAMHAMLSARVRLISQLHRTEDP